MPPFRAAQIVGARFAFFVSAGGRAFYTTDTWVSFSEGRALAVNEGAGLDAALPRSWDGDVDAAPGKNCLYSEHRVMKRE